jgi:penicillin-binding protein 1A
MVGHGYVSKEEAELSFAQYWNNYDWSRVSSNTVHSNRTRDDRAPWFTEYVREEIKNHLYGTQDVYKDGYTIYTTLDLSFQETADKYVTEQLQSMQEILLKVLDEKKREAVYNQFAHVIST